MTLQVIDGLEDGAALQALLRMAVDLAIKTDTVHLNSSKVIGILWKHAIASSDNDAFETLTSHFMEKDSGELGPMIEVFSQYIGDLDETSERFTVLASIAAKRAKWLKGEIRRLNTKFSWEMPDAEFPKNPKIEAFLRGPEASMKTVGLMSFNSLPEARKFAADCVRGMQKNASFTMKPAGKGKTAYVTITKTRKYYNDCQKKVREFQTERANLKKIYNEGSATKRARTE